jgi:hypothetical protein
MDRTPVVIPSTAADRRCRDGEIAKPDHGERWPGRRDRILDPHLPRTVLGRIAAHDDVAACVDQERIKSEMLNATRRPTQGETFSDPAQIDRTIDGQVAGAASAHERYIEPRATVARGILLDPDGDLGAVLAEPLQVDEDPRIEPTRGHAPCTLGGDDGPLQTPSDAQLGSGSCRPIQSDELGIIPEPRQRVVRSCELVDDLRPRSIRVTSECHQP